MGLKIKLKSIHPTQMPSVVAVFMQFHIDASVHEQCAKYNLDMGKK